MQRLFYIAIVLLSALPLGKAEPVVVALTPIIGDLAQQIGGEHIQVIALMNPGENPHTYSPKPDDLAQASKAQLILLSGKGLEAAFIEKIRSSLSPEAALLEVGRKVPSLMVDSTSEVFVCCPAHSVGAIDPHWWHSVKGMQRAAREVKTALNSIAPNHREHYENNYKAYIKELKVLDKWVKNRVSEIPRSQRFLTTAHSAFGYFCRDYGFKAIPVQGLSKEKNPSPKYLAETLKELKRYNIVAVFPEADANPKVLQSMVSSSGVKLSPPLIADNLTEHYPTYTAMIRHNVDTIYNALKPTPDATPTP